MAWLVGYPREKIDWFPRVDPKKCIRCGTCMNCGRNVFDWTEEGPVVARPYQCVVGCSTCANLCPGEAITFPDIEMVRQIYKKHGIWAKIKKQLIEEGKLVPRKSSR